jgi:hypothetical protein
MLNKLFESGVYVNEIISVSADELVLVSLRYSLAAAGALCVETFSVLSGSRESFASHLQAGMLLAKLQELCSLILELVLEQDEYRRSRGRIPGPSRNNPVEVVEPGFTAAQLTSYGLELCELLFQTFSVCNRPLHLA